MKDSKELYRMPSCQRVVLTIAVLLGVSLTIGGVFLYFWMPGYIESNIASKLALNNGSESYVTWQKSVLPIDFQVYLFNVTNPNEVLKGEKPQVQQMGPYGFSESREKYDIDFMDGNDSVSFRQRKFYVFSPELSDGLLNDTITLPNVPFLAISKQAQYLPGMKKILFNWMIKMYKAKPFVTKTAEELLFEGYKDDFVAALAKAQNITILPNNTFGFFYGQNGSSDGLYDILRGNENIADFAKIISFNNKEKLDTWNDTYCDMINGTDGSSYPPFVKSGGRVQMFVSDLCRSLYLDYVEDAVIKGIKLLSYAAPPQLLASPEKNPDNKCFCGGNEKCLADGVMNITLCKKGAPIIVSLPHFYLADEKYVYDVEGMQPNGSLHKTIIDIEPLTGIVMNAAKRLQMNADFGPRKGIAGYENVRQVIFPLFWVYEGATINDASADRFKSQLVKPIQLGTAVTYALLGIGCFITVCVIVYLVSRCLSNTSAEGAETSTYKASEADRQSPVTEKLLQSSNGHNSPVA